MSEAEAIAYVQEKTKGDPEVAVGLLGLILNESRQLEAAGTGPYAMKKELLDAFVRMARTSNRRVLNERLASFIRDYTL